MHSLVVVLLVLAVGYADSGNLPSFITACSYSDANLNQCIEKTITKIGPMFAERGIPELGIEPLDPVYLGNVKINAESLKINFDDTSVVGLKGFKLNYFKINTKSRKVSLDFVANVTLRANYKIDGRILFLPISGVGPCKIKITNLNINIRYEYDFVKGDDGKDRWSVKKWDSSYKMERANFKFHNLFGGNSKELAETVSRVLNESWQIVMDSIAPPAVNQIIKTCVELVKKFYAAVPAEELITS